MRYVPIGPHVHISDLRPTKELVVELKSFFEIRCVEFMPTDGAGCGWRGAFRCRHRRVGSVDHNRGALRVRQDGKAQHAGNVGGGLPQLAAGFDDLFDVRIDVIDSDIANPRRVLRQVQHAGDADLANVERGVCVITGRDILGRPADHV
jgi:hypothetical protein